MDNQSNPLNQPAPSQPEPPVPPAPAPQVINPTPLPEQPAAPTPVAPSLIEPAPLGSPTPVQSFSQPTGKSKKPLVIIGIIVGIILLLIALAGGTYVYAGSAAASYNEKVKVQANEFIETGNDLSRREADAEEFKQHVDKYQAQAPKLMAIPIIGPLNAKYKQAQKTQSIYDSLLTDYKAYNISASTFNDFSEQFSVQVKEFATLAAKVPDDPSKDPAQVSSLLTSVDAQLKKAEALPGDSNTQPVKDAYITWIKVYQTGLGKMKATPTKQVAFQVGVEMGAADTSANRAMREAINTATDKLRDTQQELRDRRSELQDSLQ